MRRIIILLLVVTVLSLLPTITVAATKCVTSPWGQTICVDVPDIGRDKTGHIWDKHIWDDEGGRRTTPRHETPHGYDSHDAVRRKIIDDALFYLKRGQYPEAAKAFEELIRLDPRDFWAHYNLGWVYQKLGLYRESVEPLKRAISINPNDVDAYRLLARAYNNLGLWREEIDTIRGLLRLNPSDDIKAEAWYAVGQANHNLGDDELAAIGYELAIHIKPDHALAYNNLGAAYFNLGRYEEAAKALKKAIALKPDFFEAYYNIGLVNSKLNRYGQALEAFEEAIRIKPDYALAYRNLGDAYFNLGQWQDAVAAHNETIRIRPDDADAHTSLGVAYYQLGRYQEAVESLRKAIQIKSDYAAPYINLSAAYTGLGRYDEAEKASRKAIQLNPNNAVAHNNLGVALERQGRDDEAEKVYREALRLDPNDSLAKKNLAELVERKEYAARPRDYKPAGIGLVGGTTGIYGYNVPTGEKGKKLREEANRKFRKLGELAGIGEEALIDPNKYNFILGVAASHGFWTDLFKRVVRDHWGEGRFSAENRELYASLKNREFVRLDCHSNGAMVCLAALELGDAKSRHVRLFGPQITPESVSRWRKLMDERKVSSVEIYINKGDPVPWVSYFFGSLDPGSPYLPLGLYVDLKLRAPDIVVKRLDCQGDIETCHSMKTYQENIGEAQK